MVENSQFVGVLGEVERPNNGSMAIQRERFEQDPLGLYKQFVTLDS